VPLTTVTFAPGETTKTVNVSVLGDTTHEPNETFNLVLSAPSAGTTISDASGTATIVNDD
jgi:chitinase